MKRTMGLSILLALFVLFLGTTGCGEDEDTSTSTTDGDTDTDTDTDSDADTDADSDSEQVSNSECDGADLDCYKDCWGCAESSATCKPLVEACLSNDICAAYYQCKLDDCCDENNNCLTGDDWESCMGNCSKEAKLTEEAFNMYAAIDKCVACDVCAVSCGEKEKDDFAMCTNPAPNTVDDACYEEKAEEGQTACFSWAGWGGPCMWDVKQCKDNEECAQLEEDINATWDFDDWSARQDVLWQNTSKEVEGLYWAYMQCIYCSACDVACLTDAGSKHCKEYDPDDDTQVFSDANTAEDDE